MKTYIALLFVALAVLHCSSAPTSDVNNEDVTPKPLPESTEASALPNASAPTSEVTNQDVTPKPLPATTEAAALPNASAPTPEVTNQDVTPKPLPATTEAAALPNASAPTSDVNNEDVTPKPLPATTEAAALPNASAPTSDVNNEDESPKPLPPTTEAAVLPTASAGQEKVTQKEKLVCMPESVFKVLCNTCRCSNDGTEMACTRRFCSEEVNDDGSLKVPVPTTEAPVVENASGTTQEATSEASSTLDLESIPKIPWGPLYVQGTPCPEKTFYSECNQCFCSKNGVSAACTLILCDALRKIDEKQNEDTAVVVVD